MRHTAPLAHGPGLAAGLHNPHSIGCCRMPPARASPRPADAPGTAAAAARAASTAAARPSASSAAGTVNRSARSKACNRGHGSACDLAPAFSIILGREHVRG